MSFLDTIKNLFFRKNAEEIEGKQSTEAKVTTDPVVEPASESEQQVEPEVKTDFTVESDLKPNTASAGLKIPEDSALRRHFLANLDAEKQPKVIETKAPAVEKKQEEIVIEVIEEAVAIQIPQDSALKRHYISALKYKIEDNMLDRPTDSTLKRHYNAAVQAELENLLAGDKGK